MKLDIDLDPLAKASVETQSALSAKSDEAKEMLRKSIKLAKDGQRSEARSLLLKVTEAEPKNEAAWLWLASISEYPEELLVFLQNVLKINPQNERAIEWASATKTLLSKTFVQRGISASHEDQKEFAKQCFLQAIVHDSENEMAWLWLASSSEAPEEKISHLQRALAINPDNEAAQSSLKSVKSQMTTSDLKKATEAAFSGERAQASELLQSILRQDPQSEDALILKAYLADGFEEKIACYERVLELNPNNDAANSGLASLRAMLPKLPQAQESASHEDMQTDQQAAQESAAEDTAETNEQAQQSAPESVASDVVEAQDHSADRPDNPTQELDENYEKRISEEWGTGAEQSAQATEAVEATDAPPIVASGKELSFEIVEEESEVASQVEEAASQAVAVEDAPEAVHEAKQEEPQLEETAQPELESLPQEVETEAAEPAVQETLKLCPMCSAENAPLSNVCISCRAILSLSDIEALLAYNEADQSVMLHAAEKFEIEKTARDLDSTELTNLALAYLNTRNPRKALVYLTEASNLSPRDTLLSSAVYHIKAYVAEADSHQNVPEQSNGAGVKTIMVVDDSATVRKLISGKLEKSGHSVITAVDGMDALAKINEVVPDLVLLDITMPRLDGYQVCKLIRNNEATKDVPVVMISGKDGFFDKVRGRMAGTNGYITKPFGPDTLMKTIELYLQ